MTADPFTPAPLNPAALDAAWKSYNHGSVSFNAALTAMAAAGVTLAEARGLLDAHSARRRDTWR